MNIIQDIIDKNVTINEEEFVERRNLKEIVLNQKDKIKEISKELDIQKELFQQYSHKYTTYDRNLENQFFSIIVKEFKNLYLRTYYKKISSQTFIHIKEISNHYSSKGYVKLKVTVLRTYPDVHYYEDTEYKFFNIADLKEFFNDYILLKEPELTKIATFMLLSSNLIHDNK